MAIPASNIIILDHSAESRRAMRQALASMGTLGVNVRHTTGHVALMFSYYRTAQRSVGGPGAICGTPAAWRGKVRKSIAAARAARQALRAAA
jgi:hypothetical protein